MKHRISHKKYNGHRVYRDTDPYNPLNLPPYTIRLRYEEGVTPTFSKGTGVQVSSSPNIWDWTNESSDWSGSFGDESYLIEVLGGNTISVTNMSRTFYKCSNLATVNIFDTHTVTNMTQMFYGCTSLTTVPLFDTQNVEGMTHMFYGCTSLTNVPLFNTSKATGMHGMFYGCKSLTSVPLFDTQNVDDMYSTFRDCTNVQSGALALYQQASTQTNPPRFHSQTFTNCGINTQTGSAELAQIPASWK